MIGRRKAILSALAAPAATLGSRRQPASEVRSVDSIAALKAADTRDGYEVLGFSGLAGMFIWTPGDFTGKADDIDVVASDKAPLTTGAWVRQDASSMTFRGDFPGAPLRGLQDRLRDAVSVRDNLAAGLNGPADKPLIQSLSDRVTSGKTLDVPVGQYAFSNGGLVQRREHGWSFETGALFRGDYEAGEFDSLLTVQIGDAGESRGSFISRGRFLVRNRAYVQGRSPVAEQFSRGGYAIELKAAGTGASIINHRISHASVSGGKGAVSYLGANADQTIAWSGIEKSTIVNGVVCSQTADGMAFRDNISDGIETAYKFDLIEGAFCCTIDGGTTSNRKGALDVVNGSLWRIVNCQMEHGVNFAGHSAADFTVLVRGASYRSYLGIIRQNNFGAGVGRVRNTIAIQNAAGTVIDENYFFLSDEADVRIESAASNTILGARNMARGQRKIRPAGEYTDTSRRLVISLPADRAGSRAVGTRGVWHPAAHVLTGFQNSWVLDDLEILLTEDGLVVFNGGLNGGALTGGICTFPVWLRPHQDAYLHATIVADGGVRGLKLSAASGDLTIVGALPSAKLNLSNAFFAAVLNLPYTIGP